MPTPQSFEEMLAADPRLKDNSSTFGSSSDSNRPTDASVVLPDSFPKVIPVYPNSQLKEVTQPNRQDSASSAEPAVAGAAQPPDTTSEGTVTRWVSSDPINVVQSFYLREFQKNNWSLTKSEDAQANQTEVQENQPNNGQGEKISARLNDLQVIVSIRPASSSTPSPTPSPSQAGASQDAQAVTEFNIQYNNNSTANTAPIEPDSSNAQAQVPQPGAPEFIGPVPPPEQAATPNVTSTPPVDNTNTVPNTSSGGTQKSDLGNVPPELRGYIQDLAALGVLSPESGEAKSNQSDTTQFQPNKIISRREFARWLVAANNQIRSNNQSQQIRGASSASQPAFQDVRPQDPDFAVIQGLAEAGLIPSSLSGDSTAVLFRPDAPLTREQMILWKVPLDNRQALPNASVDAVKQSWGFQDAARIDPKALRAVLADFQNSEQSNIRRVFGFTTLFQPKKAVTRMEAAAALWYFGSPTEGLSARDALQLKTQSSPSPTPNNSQPVTQP